MSPIERGLVALASDTTVSTSLFLPSSSAASIIARTGLGSGLGSVSETSAGMAAGISSGDTVGPDRSEEHTSELQSLMRLSYAVFCLYKTKRLHNTNNSSHALIDKTIHIETQLETRQH